MKFGALCACLLVTISVLGLILALYLGVATRDPLILMTLAGTGVLLVGIVVQTRRRRRLHFAKTLGLRPVQSREAVLKAFREPGVSDEVVERLLEAVAAFSCCEVGQLRVDDQFHEELAPPAPGLQPENLINAMLSHFIEKYGDSYPNFKTVTVTKPLVTLKDFVQLAGPAVEASRPIKK
jgi:hypothetical protein